MQDDPNDQIAEQLLKDFCRVLGNQIDRVLPNVIWVVTKSDQVSEDYRSISPREHLSNMYDDILKFLEASDISNEDGRAVLKVIEYFLNENNAKRFLYSKTDDRVCFDSLHKQFDLFKPLPANQLSFGEKDAQLKAVYSLVRNLDRIEENISDKEKELKREQLAFKKELEDRGRFFDGAIRRRDFSEVSKELKIMGDIRTVYISKEAECVALEKGRRFVEEFSSPLRLALKPGCG